MSVSYLNDSYLKKAQEELPEQDSFVQEAEQMLKDRIRAAGAAGANASDQGGYSQVDLRPQWYKTFLKDKNYEQNGPPLQSQGAAATEKALGYLGQNANQRAAALQGNDRGSGHSVALSNMGTLLGLGSVLTNAFTKKDSDDFDTQQARAVKDANALKKNTKTGMSNNELLGYLNYEKTGLRNAQLARRDAEKAAQTITEADPNSKESHDTQSALVSSGIIAPEQAASISKENLKLARPGFMQTQNQREALNRFDYENAVTEGNKLGAEERGQTRQVEQEQREAQLRLAQAAIPGHRWANDQPPPPAVQEKAREFAGAQHELIEGAQEMKKIQAALVSLGQQQGWRPEVLGPAAFGQNIDKYLGDETAKQLLARAQFIQQKMVTAARKDDNLGVLQQFEKQMEDSVNPTAGTIGAYFRGTAPWDAISDYYTRYGREKKKTFGLYEDTDPDRPQNNPSAVPAQDQVTHYERPVARRPTPGQQTPTSAGGEDYGAQPGDKLPVAPIPADARRMPAAPQPRQGADNADALNGTYVVEVNGKRSQPRQLNKEQYKMLLQKYGLDAVKRVQ